MIDEVAEHILIYVMYIWQAKLILFVTHLQGSGTIFQTVWDCAKQSGVVLSAPNNCNVALEKG